MDIGSGSQSELNWDDGMGCNDDFRPTTTRRKETMPKKLRRPQKEKRVCGQYEIPYPHKVFDGIRRCPPKINVFFNNQLPQQTTSDDTVFKYQI